MVIIYTHVLYVMQALLKVELDSLFVVNADTIAIESHTE